jgi:hypothetical protein
MQGARSASPIRSERRGDRRSRRSSVAKQLESRRAAPELHPHRHAPSRARGRGRGRFEGRLREEAASPRDAPKLSGEKNPLFKERAPELHVAYRSPSFHPAERRVSRFMSLHSLRITLVRAGGGVFFRLRVRTGSSLTFLGGPPPAGPHERCRLSTTRNAFHRTKRRRSPGASFLARARPFAPPWPRPRRKRVALAPFIDFCNRREGRAHPPSGPLPRPPAC